VEVELEAVHKEIDERNVATLLKGADIVVDALDNSASRGLLQQHCRAVGLQCLCVGLYADYCEAIWDENYRVAGDVCEYPLARNLVLLPWPWPPSCSFARFSAAKSTTTPAPCGLPQPGSLIPSRGRASKFASVSYSGNN
jgi:hypothetical protein